MKSKNDAIFQGIVYALTALVCIVTLYPLIYVLSASFSNPARILGGDVVLWPVEFTLNSYKRVFASSDILTGYRNTLIYTATGTTLNMIATIMAAYPLSLPDLKGKNAITIFITFTMFFGAGMIPNYLNIKSLGLLNNPLVIIVPGAISVSNMLIMRNFFYAIPDALEEAAYLDGANQFTILIRVILPLSLPSIATIAMFYAVSFWNAWFPGVMYLTDAKLVPVQNVMRTIIISATAALEDMGVTIDDVQQAPTSHTLKCASIVVTTLPILCVYPFIQKYFVKGVMVGSVKG